MGYLTLQEEEDGSLNKAAIEALPAPPGQSLFLRSTMTEEPSAQ